MTKLTINLAERDLGIEMWITDHLHLVRWLHARYEHAPLVWAGIEKDAVIALAQNADSAPHWRKLASFAFTELKSIESERALTPMERRIREIAERCYDAEKVAAERHGIDLFPEDTDRAEARQKRDEAYARALEQLAPYLNKGAVQ